MNARTLSAYVVVGAALGSGAAGAAPVKGHAVTLDDLVIIGRIQKPLATVEISRVPPKLTLTELKQTFTVEIEHAATRDPY
jgi:hypothetical protein